MKSSVNQYTYRKACKMLSKKVRQSLWLSKNWTELSIKNVILMCMGIETCRLVLQKWNSYRTLCMPNIERCTGYIIVIHLLLCHILTLSVILCNIYFAQFVVWSHGHMVLLVILDIANPVLFNLSHAPCISISMLIITFFLYLNFSVTVV